MVILVFDMIKNIVGKRENATSYQHLLLFPQCLKMFPSQVVKPFPKRQISDFSKMKEFADYNFNFDLKGRTFSNTVGEGEIACYKQFLLFPVFSKDLYCRHVKPTACLGKG